MKSKIEKCLRIRLIIYHTLITMATSSQNKFAAAMVQKAQLTTGDNGALLHSTSGNVFIDYFTNITRDSSHETVSHAVRDMVNFARNHYSTTGDISYISYLFQFWAFKRSCRSELGEGIRTVSHYYLFELYKYFPDTVCSMVRNGLSGEYGYWKDIESMMILIHTTSQMTSPERYKHFDPLVSAMTDAMLEQRSRDIDALDVWCKKHFGKASRYITTEEISDKILEEDVKAPSISLVGSWITREKSADNKKAYWYVGPYDAPVKVTNSCYMVRKLLNVTVRPSGGGGGGDTGAEETHTYPVDKQVPFGAMKRYRQANARLTAASGKVEQFMCQNRWDKIEHSRIPSIAGFRLRKALANEKLKQTPVGNETYTGNRFPEDEKRVACRRNMISNLSSGEDGAVNVNGLEPHIIAVKSQSATGIDEEYINTAWKEKVRLYRERMETIKAAHEAETWTAVAGEVANEVGNSALNGNFIAVADTSGSMTFEGTAPNRPFDICVGLTAFMSEVASEQYRDLSFTFSNHPRALHFKRPDGTSMSVSERMRMITSNDNVGYNTNIMKLHQLVIQIMVENKITDPPNLVIFSDGEFDSQCSTNMDSHNTTHENIVRMYADAGIKNMATIVYWNLSKKSFNKGTQTNANYPGVIFLQGTSEKNFDFILYGEGADKIVNTVVKSDGTTHDMTVSSITPLETFLKAMDNDPFYKHIHLVLNSSNEFELSSYSKLLSD